MNRTISYKTLAELLRLERKYDMTGDVNLLSARNKAATKLSEEAFGKRQFLGYGSGAFWVNLSGAFCGCFSGYKHYTNKEVIRILNVMGFEVEGAENEEIAE